MTNPHQDLARERRAFTLFAAARVKGLSSEDVARPGHLLHLKAKMGSPETWQRVVEMLREMEVAEMEGAMR